MTEILLETKDLTKEYISKSGFFRKTVHTLRAVDQVNLTIHKGEILGLVGESGSGKSTLSSMLMNLIFPSKGEIFYQGNPLYQERGRGKSHVPRLMQMIFQNPFGALDPKMNIEEILEEPLRAAKISFPNRQKKIRELLDLVGMSKHVLERKPKAFSGGQRQRITIARALALDPEILIADEPVSALDVSIQAQILNLLLDIQMEKNLTMLFVSHDLNVVQYMARRTAVMYRGRIVEIDASENLYQNPRHPYTKLLLSSIPQTQVQPCMDDPGDRPIHPEQGNLAKERKI